MDYTLFSNSINSHLKNEIYRILSENIVLQIESKFVPYLWVTHNFGSTVSIYQGNECKLDSIYKNFYTNTNTRRYTDRKTILPASRSDPQDSVTRPQALILKKLNISLLLCNRETKSKAWIKNVNVNGKLKLNPIVYSILVMLRRKFIEFSTWTTFRMFKFHFIAF